MNDKDFILRPDSPVLSARQAPWWTVALLGSILFADVAVPPTLCVPLLYVLPVLVASLTLSRTAIALTAGIATLLTVGEPYALGEADRLSMFVVANRGLSLTMCWAVALMRIAQLRQERYRREWAAVAVASRDAILAMNLDGKVREWNAKAEALYGHAAGEVIGMRVDEATGAETPRLIKAIENLAKGRLEETFQDRHRTVAGRPIDVAITLSPVRESGGRLIGVSASVRDVTLEMRAQAALVESEERHRKLSRKLDYAARQKDAFIAMLGHELRNPLGAISNAAGVLRIAGSESSRGQRALEIVESQVGIMRHQLDDLLELSRLERGEVELKPAPVALGEIIRMSVDAIGEHLRSGGLTFDVPQVPEDIVVNADKFRIGQVMHNLLDNARKFTRSPGAVRIEIQEQGGDVAVTVSDTGIGIDPALLPHIFEEFAQAEQSLSRQSGGLGLGLAIVRRIVELHGGAVRADSTGVEGEGARFTFVLPKHDGRALPDAAASAKGHNGDADRTKRVMIADDNVEALQALSDYLELNEYIVTQSIDGESVLRELESVWPDVLVLDIGLPGRDGFEVAREVRSRWPDRTCVLIAVTGYGSEKVSEQAREAGFDHYLVKPVKLEELRDCIG